MVLFMKYGAFEDVALGRVENMSLFVESGAFEDVVESAAGSSISPSRGSA